MEWSKVTPPKGGWHIPLPSENQSLYNYLQSGSFSRHQARLDRENAHIILAEIIIQATAEQTFMKRLGTPSSTCSSDVVTRRDNSAEGVALALLDHFHDKHVTKACELNWMVSEQQAPQDLLPLPSGYVADPEINSNESSIRGTYSWAPPRPQLILTCFVGKGRTTIMDQQNYRCSGCGMKVEKKYIKTFRFCHYSGKYFCTSCHTNLHHVIPGAIITKWDFKE